MAFFDDVALNETLLAKFKFTAEARPMIDAEESDSQSLDTFRDVQYVWDREGIVSHRRDETLEHLAAGILKQALEERARLLRLIASPASVRTEAERDIPMLEAEFQHSRGIQFVSGCASHFTDELPGESHEARQRDEANRAVLSALSKAPETRKANGRIGKYQKTSDWRWYMLIPAFQVELIASFQSSILSLRAERRRQAVRSVAIP